MAVKRICVVRNRRGFRGTAASALQRRRTVVTTPPNDAGPTSVGYRWTILACYLLTTSTTSTKVLGILDPTLQLDLQWTEGIWCIRLLVQSCIRRRLIAMGRVVDALARAGRRLCDVVWSLAAMAPR